MMKISFEKTELQTLVKHTNQGPEAMALWETCRFPQAGGNFANENELRALQMKGERENT
jgi:hypothetical protein